MYRTGRRRSVTHSLSRSVSLSASLPPCLQPFIAKEPLARENCRSHQIHRFMRSRCLVHAETTSRSPWPGTCRSFLMPTGWRQALAGWLLLLLRRSACSCQLDHLLYILPRQSSLLNCTCARLHARPQADHAHQSRHGNTRKHANTLVSRPQCNKAQLF